MLDAPDSPFSRDYATPTQAPDLFSLVLTDLEEVYSIECYNRCHGEGGRFCETGGKTKVAPYRTKLKFKKAFSETTSNGQKVWLLDRVGVEDVSGLEEGLRTVAALQSTYNVKGFNGVIVHKEGTGHGKNAVPSNVAGWVFPNNSNWIHTVDQDKYKTLYDSFRKRNPSNFMPAVRDKTVSLIRATLTHEFGHVQFHDMERKQGRWPTLMRAAVVWHNPAVRKSLSNYGQVNMMEGYSEAFAEWHISGGKSRNIAANTYAQEFGWVGAPKVKKTAVAASLETLLAVDGPPVTDADLDANFDQPVIIEDWVNGPRLLGITLLDVEIDGPEVQRIDDLVRQVIEDLGEDMEPFTSLPFSGQAPDLFSLVDLHLIEGEDGTHWHWNPLVECYNMCHDGDGRFCSGPGAGLTGKSTLPDKDGDVGPRAPGPVPRGKHGGSLIDPHDGTKTIDGVRGYDKTGKFDKKGKPGKPVPGTDAWLEAHGLDKKTFESRPYVRYEADRGDPALAEAYKDYPRASAFFKKSAEQEGQQGGYIMIKHEVPGSPYGPVPPQIRPNKDLITDQRIKAQKEASYNNAVARLEVLKETTGPVLVRERKERLKQAELNLERIKTATPETVRKEAAYNLAAAHEGLAKAKESGTSDDVLVAKKTLASVQRASIKEMRRADRWDPEHELYDAETSVKWAKTRLEKAQTDPKAALLAEIKTQESTVKRAKKASDGASAKYVFAPGTQVARIEMHPDPLNVKNLTEGKGRIYFAMEGSIKNDAIFTALRREDPTASVVNVPSVTLWQEKGGNAGEIKWFAGKYGKGREIILIPDADGINNPNVMQQAKAMSAALKTFGAGSVLLATPPLKPGTKYVIDKFNLPSGREEERKGIDDHLGAGRGTLGQLQFTRNVKAPSYDLSWAGKVEAKAAGVAGINKNAIPHTEKALAAISSIVGPEGTSRITKNILAQASGLPQTSALEARERLKKLGIISVEHIFDEQALSRGKRIRNPSVSPERVDELVRRKIISEPRLDQLYTDANFDEAPVITIRDSRYLIKHSDVDTGTLSDLSTWNPPKSYKGWTSPVTRQPDTTGIAARQVEAQKKTAAKRAANKKFESQANRDADIKSSLERKVAAPGRRLVRTPEGARRYGVPIGSPIPIFAAETVSSTPATGFSMILGLIEPIELGNTVNRTEFYNSCHDEEGKFCPTSGGSGSGISGKSTLTGNSKWRSETVDSAAMEWTGSWPPSSGRHVAIIAGKRFGTVTLNGIKAKTVYEVTAANGNKVRLYDRTGKAGPYASDLLNNHARMNEMYPLKPTRNLIVSKFGVKDQNTFASVHHGERATYVNADRLGYDVKNLRPGFQMPSSHTGNTTNHDYILTHEYGHHVDFSKNVVNGVYTKHPLVYNQDFRSNMSRYGNGQADNGLTRAGVTDSYQSIESYAEAFGEWHHSNGTTRNPAAIALARSENWYGTEDRRSMAAAATWDPADIAAWYNPLFDTTAQNLVQFGDLFSFAVEEDDMEDEDMVFELPVAGKDGIGVADDFEAGEATILGDFESKDASEEDVAKANAIMQAVLKELGEKDHG